MRRLSVFLLASLAALAPQAAQAAPGVLVTNLACFSPGSTVDNFNCAQFETCGFIFGTGPTAVGNGVTFTSTDANTVIGNGGYGLSANGHWCGTGANLATRGGYTGLNIGCNKSCFMTFTFSSPVAQVGGCINYAPHCGTGAVISVFNGGTLLDSFNLKTCAPICTPCPCNGAGFRGISEPVADITSFQLSNNYVVLDNLTFNTTPAAGAPEPPVPLILGSLFGVAALRRMLGR